MIYIWLFVVYRPFPTSNHNADLEFTKTVKVVYRPFPTSNHNAARARMYLLAVVYRPFPTSNHNGDGNVTEYTSLYIVRFLHQTTTNRLLLVGSARCISSVSYIKPQLFKW